MSEGLKYNPVKEDSDKYKKNQEILDSAYELMRTKGLKNTRATRFVVNSGSYDLSLMNDEQFIDAVTRHHSGRRFWILEGAHPDLEHRVIMTKIRVTGEDEKHEANNETCFYRDIREGVISGMPEELVGKIQIPAYKASGVSDEGFNYLQTEFAEGGILSPVHFEASEEPMDEEDYIAIMKFVKYLQQTVTPQNINDLSPDFELNSEGACPTNVRNIEMLSEHEEEYRQWLGDDIYTKMLSVLKNYQQVEDDLPGVVANCDLNMSNMVKSEDGKVTIIDWERLKLINNFATACSYMPSSHWMYPEIQKSMIKKLIELNIDIPNYKTQLKMSLLFYRYARIPLMYYWLPLRNGALSSEKEETAKSALNCFKRLINEILESDGIWEED